MAFPNLRALLPVKYSHVVSPKSSRGRLLAASSLPSQITTVMTHLTYIPLLTNVILTVVARNYIHRTKVVYLNF